MFKGDGRVCVEKEAWFDDHDMRLNFGMHTRGALTTGAQAQFDACNAEFPRGMGGSAPHATNTRAPVDGLKQG